MVEVTDVSQITQLDFFRGLIQKFPQSDNNLVRALQLQFGGKLVTGCISGEMDERLPYKSEHTMAAFISDTDGFARVQNAFLEAYLHCRDEMSYNRTDKIALHECANFFIQELTTIATEHGKTLDWDDFASQTKECFEVSLPAEPLVMGKNRVLLGSIETGINGIKRYGLRLLNRADMGNGREVKGM